jgi:AhpD family alkylhydroperoxidase
MDKIEKFIEEREQLNRIVLDNCGKDIKRFFTLDGAVYKEGAFSEKIKESLGLVASMVLRCDDCINYHILQAKKKGLSSEEFDEILSIALIVGGSIVIPHLRRAMGVWEELKSSEQ